MNQLPPGPPTGTQPPNPSRHLQTVIPGQFSVIQRRNVQLPVEGKIRPGIKVLTPAAAANPAIKRIYEEGLVKGSSFDDIASRVRLETQFEKNPLRPSNAPYFTVRSSDFANPQTAAKLMELYGEVRPEIDKEKRLYQFPVVFPVDNPLMVLPHDLKSWTASGLQFWSEYNENGERFCKTYAPVPKKDGKAIRQFGGRTIMLRPENGGRCDPTRCPQYQASACNLEGRFVVFIPGIHGVLPIAIPTRSFYSISNAMATLELVRTIRGGQVSGAIGQADMTFFITKRLEEVSRIDEHGNPVRVKQWLVSLEAKADIAKLLIERSMTPALVGQQAAAMLTGTAAPVAHEVVAADSGQVIQGQARVVMEDDDGTVVVQQAALNQQIAALGLPANYATMSEAEKLTALRDRLSDRLGNTFGIELNHFRPFARARYGKGWGTAVTPLFAVLVDLAQVTPEGVESFLAEVKIEADAAASAATKGGES